MTKVAETDGWWDDEEEGGDTSQDGERLGEVLWSFHLGDECWEQDLRNPQEGDVQDGVHGGDEGCACWWEGVGLDRAECWIITAVSVQWSVLDTCEDHEEQDSETHACCAEHRHERDVLQGTWDRHHDADHHGDDAEHDSAL